MREIKFRAFAKDERKMYKVTAIDFAKRSVSLEAPYPYGKITGTLPLSAVVLMQYTGLKDKNDKEKYEADICKDTSGTYVIEWQLAGFKAVFIDGRHKGQIKDLAHVAANGEIIGNIYENPELLQ